MSNLYTFWYMVYTNPCFAPKRKYRTAHENNLTIATTSIIRGTCASIIIVLFITNIIPLLIIKKIHPSQQSKNLFSSLSSSIRKKSSALQQHWENVVHRGLRWPIYYRKSMVVDRNTIILNKINSENGHFTINLADKLTSTCLKERNNEKQTTTTTTRSCKNNKNKYQGQNKTKTPTLYNDKDMRKK